MQPEFTRPDFMDGTSADDIHRRMMAELLDKSRQPWPVSAMVTSTTHRISEEMEDVTLITRKDLAYLNGSLRLDGTRILDSEYHKEAI